MKSMNVLHVGNLANIGYYLVKELRKDSIDAELLMHKDPELTADPKNYDPELKENYYDWIKFYDLKGHWKFQILKIMRNKKYELIHAYVEGPIFAQFTNKPFIAHVLGSDLRELAFTNSIKGFLLKRAYKKAKAVLFYDPKLLLQLKKLGIKNKIFFPHIPNKIFCPTDIKNKQFDSDYIIFHPTRADWKLKGNDILIKGFAKFLKNNPNALLILVEGKISTKYNEQNHKLIKKLKIEKNITFLKGPLNTSDLAYYYNCSDVVADQFTLGEGGLIYLEAMACKKPVLINLDLSEQKKVFKEPPPIVYAATSEEINQCLEKLKDKEVREKIGEKSFLWINKFLNRDDSIKKLISIYKKILNNDSLNEFIVN